MTVVAASSAGYLERPRSSGLADVIDLILDKGLVIDAFVRVSLLGLELLTIDARIVIASVDTYLRFAEAVDRVVLGRASDTGVADLLGDSMEGGARRKVKGVAEGAKDSIKDTFGADGQGEREPSKQAGNQ